MKKLFTLGALLIVGAVFAADPAALIKEGQAAFKAKDYNTAVAKYGEAQNAATTNIQKRSAILGKFQALIKLNKHADARSFMEEAVEDEGLKNEDIRFLLNFLAVPYLWWPSEHKYALDILKQAQNVEMTKTSNTYFQTYYYMACIYSHRKEYEPILEIMPAVTQITGQHPANKKTAYYYIGVAYEKLGKKAEALEAYKKSVEWGKKVTYKYDYSDAVKAVERLSK